MQAQEKVPNHNDAYGDTPLIVRPDENQERTPSRYSSFQAELEDHAKPRCQGCSRADGYLSSYCFGCTCGPLEFVMLVGASVFGWRLMPVSIIASAYIIGFGGAVFMALACVVTVLITNTGKAVFGRERPSLSLISARRQFQIRDQFNNPAFPSGDSAQAAVFAISVALIRPELWGVLFIIPWTMAARIYYACHWFGDTVAGALIGAGVTTAIFFTVPNHFTKMQFPV